MDSVSIALQLIVFCIYNPLQCTTIEIPYSSIYGKSVQITQVCEGSLRPQTRMNSSGYKVITKDKVFIIETVGCLQENI